MRMIPRSFFALSLMASAPFAQLVISHQSATGANGANQIKPYLKVENQGTTTVDLAKSTFDYLIYEDGVNAGSLVADCWYVSVGACNDMTAEMGAIPLQTDGTRKANLRVRLGFRAGQLAAGQSLLIQWGLHEQGYQHIFDESDDWSFTEGDGAWHLSSRVAVNTSVTSSTNATAMQWKGVIANLPDPATSKTGDVVRNQAKGETWVFSNGTWVLLAEAGKPGPAGAAGAPGAQGDPGISGTSTDATLLARIAALESLVSKLSSGQSTTVSSGASVTSLNGIKDAVSLTGTKGLNVITDPANSSVVVEGNGLVVNVDSTKLPTSVLKFPAGTSPKSIQARYDTLTDPKSGHGGTTRIDLNPGKAELKLSASGYGYVPGGGGGADGSITLTPNSATFSDEIVAPSVSTGLIHASSTVGAANYYQSITMQPGTASMELKVTGAGTYAGASGTITLDPNSTTFSNSIVALSATLSGLIVDNSNLQLKGTPTTHSGTCTGSEGTISWSNDFLYVCTAVGWKKAVLTIAP